MTRHRKSSGRRIAHTPEETKAAILWDASERHMAEAMSIGYDPASNRINPKKWSSYFGLPESWAPANPVVYGPVDHTDPNNPPIPFLDALRRACFLIQSCRAAEDMEVRFEGWRTAFGASAGIPGFHQALETASLQWWRRFNPFAVCPTITRKFDREADLIIFGAVRVGTDTSYQHEFLREHGAAIGRATERHGASFILELAKSVEHRTASHELPQLHKPEPKGETYPPSAYDRPDADRSWLIENWIGRGLWLMKRQDLADFAPCSPDQASDAFKPSGLGLHRHPSQPLKFKREGHELTVDPELENSLPPEFSKFSARFSSFGTPTNVA